jgi:hypothetical protein
VHLAVLDDEPLLSLHDKAGKERVCLSVLDDEPAVVVCDGAGSDRAVLGVAHLKLTRTGAKETTAESSLVLFDKDGKVIHRAP